MIQEVTNSGSMPALEATLRFAAQRQRLIASNIANISTPNYRMQDVSIEGFQKALRQAVDQRRASSGGQSGELPLAQTSELRPGPGGNLELRPSPVSQGILFHDRNNRDLERLMQDQVENALVFRVAGDLLKSKYDLLRTAISERV